MEIPGTDPNRPPFKMPKPAPDVEAAPPRPTVTCETCGATGHSYFGGHDDSYSPHPWYASTGSEGRCELCGGPSDALVHTAHNRLRLAPR